MPITTDILFQYPLASVSSGIGISMQLHHIITIGMKIDIGISISIGIGVCIGVCIRNNTWSIKKLHYKRKQAQLGVPHSEIQVELNL